MYDLYSSLCQTCSICFLHCIRLIAFIFFSLSDVLYVFLSLCQTWSLRSWKIFEHQQILTSVFVSASTEYCDPDWSCLQRIDALRLTGGGTASSEVSTISLDTIVGDQEVELLLLTCQTMELSVKYPFCGHAWCASCSRHHLIWCLQMEQWNILWGAMYADVRCFLPTVCTLHQLCIFFSPVRFVWKLKGWLHAACMSNESLNKLCGNAGSQRCNKSTEKREDQEPFSASAWRFTVSFCQNWLCFYLLGCRLPECFFMCGDWVVATDSLLSSALPHRRLTLCGFLFGILSSCMGICLAFAQLSFRLKSVLGCLSFLCSA